MKTADLMAEVAHTDEERDVAAYLRALALREGVRLLRTASSKLAKIQRRIQRRSSKSPEKNPAKVQCELRRCN